MEKILIAILICCMSIFRMSDVPSEHFNEEFQREEAVDEFESSPFQVMLDRTPLETGQSEKITCYVVSKVDDFSYSVSAEKGKIKNKKSVSFDYFKSGEASTDTIHLDCIDKTTGQEYSFSIPFVFSNAMPIVEPDDFIIQRAELSYRGCFY